MLSKSENFEVTLRNFELIKKEKVLSCRRLTNGYKGILIKNLANVWRIWSLKDNISEFGLNGLGQPKCDVILRIKKFWLRLKGPVPEMCLAMHVGL